MTSYLKNAEAEIKPSLRPIYREYMTILGFFGDTGKYKDRVKPKGSENVMDKKVLGYLTIMMESSIKDGMATSEAYDRMLEFDSYVCIDGTRVSYKYFSVKYSRVRKKMGVKSPSIGDRVVSMYNNGYELEFISKKIRVSHKTVLRYVRKHKKESTNE